MKTGIWKTRLQLFLSFFKIGLFTFGGGYAMIPLIEREASERRKWITGDDLLEIIAIAESTPGPVAVNSATFIGYRTAGVLGGAIATFGVVLPSFLIILLLSYVLRMFQENPYVRYAFFGVRAGVLALILKAWWSMFRKCPKGLIAYLIAAAAFAAVCVFRVSVFPVILGCAAIGLVSSLLLAGRARKGGGES